VAKRDISKHGRRKVNQLNPRFVYLVVSTMLLTTLYSADRCWHALTPLPFPLSSDIQPLDQRVYTAMQNKFVRRTVPLLIANNFALPLLWVTLKGPILRRLVYNTSLRYGSVNESKQCLMV